MTRLTQYAMIATIAAALLGAYTVLTTATVAYAGGDYDKKKCDSTDVPPFKDLPDAAGETGNPHTCQQPTGDPHDDEDNPDSGNPHNT
jgi:hypothetical protein